MTLKDENSDNVIMNELAQLMIPHANTRIAFRAMKAAEAQAATLASIAESLAKLARPPTIFDSGAGDSNADFCASTITRAAAAPGSYTFIADQEAQVVAEGGIPNSAKREPELTASQIAQRKSVAEFQREQAERASQVPEPAFEQSVKSVESDAGDRDDISDL